MQRSSIRLADMTHPSSGRRAARVAKTERSVVSVKKFPIEPDVHRPAAMNFTNQCP
jgi:hypothetical protein